MLLFKLTERSGVTTLTEQILSITESTISRLSIKPIN